MAMGDLARSDEYGGDNSLLPTPRNPAMPPQSVVDLFTPNLSRPETYAPRSADLIPNEAGKVPTSDPLTTGFAADAANMAGYAIPFGGPIAGAAAKVAVPLLAVGRRLVPAAEEAAVTGIRAYHSSPHDFDKFDFSRIGTGEGAQVYGHGGYFAENPAVSGQGGEYWNNFLHRFEGPENIAAQQLSGYGFDRKAAIDSLREGIALKQKVLQSGELYPGHKIPEAGVTGRIEAIDRLSKAKELLESGKPVGPRTYEVNIAARPEQMLDWDKPLAQQGRVGADAARIAGLPDDVLHATPGATAYRTAGASDRTAAALREAGIPGIRYLDQGSRMNATSTFPQLRDLPRTSNYVMFPGTEDRIKILKKYGVAGAVPTMGAFAADDRYDNQ
jgi:hypothetical protein